MIVLQTAKSFVMLRVLNDIKRELAEQRQAARERLEDSNNQDKTSLSQVCVLLFLNILIQNGKFVFHPLIKSLMGK